MSPVARRPSGLLVLGMHRSGTSATAGALAAAGFHMGAELIEGAQDNPGGYFEHAGVVTAHEDLFESLDRAWDDVRALPADWASSDAAGKAQSRLAAVLTQDLRERKPWVVKDPRLCRLLPLWAPLLDKAQVRVAVLLVLRHPDEVAASLARRDRMPPDVAHLLWLRHVLEAEAQSREWPRACILYDELLRDPGATLSDALGACGIKAPGQLAMAARHVSTDARHESTRSGPQSPWRQLALSLHEAVVAGGDRFAAIAGMAGDFDSLLQAHASWIDSIGRQQSAGRAGIRRWREQALAAAGRAEQLQAGLDVASALSLSQLEELRALDARLARTSEALQAAERLLKEARAEARDLVEQVRSAGDARDQAERLLGEARAQSGALDRRVASEAEARARTEALALARLQDIERLDALLAETAEAKAHAETLAYSRQAALEALEAGLASLANRLDALAGGEGTRPQHADTVDGENAGDAGDFDPLRGLVRTTGSVEAAMGGAREVLASALGRVGALEDELQGMRTSLWWRMGHPFRTLRGWMRRP